MNICEKSNAYYDGALSPDEETAFREHLAACARCQDSLHELTQLHFLEIRASDAPRLVKVSKSRRGTKILYYALAAVAAVALVVVLQKSRSPGRGEELLAQGAAARPFEAWLAHPGLKSYKPYNPLAGAGAAAVGNSIALNRLARLEQAADWHGLGAAYLWNGEIERAEPYLERAEESPAVDNDLAVLVLARGDYPASLHRLDRVLTSAPSLIQAHWNRALVLHHLGLDLQAAAEFAAVAASGEAGWAGEARDYAERLQGQVRTARTSWQLMTAAGRELVQSGKPVSEELLSSYPDELRMYFYDAVRAAPSAERVLALRPVAISLDRHFGGDFLQSYLSRVTTSPFLIRARLATAYQHLATDYTSVSAQSAEELIRALRTNKQDDILLGALLVTEQVADNLTEYLHLAAESGDPWFAILSEQVRVTTALGQGLALTAEPRLVRAAAECKDSPLQYRCAYLYFTLGDLYKQLNRTVEAKFQAQAALALARKIKAWDLETSVLGLIGDIAFFENDYSLTSAYLREVSLRTKLDGSDCRWTRFLNEHLAMVDLFNYRFDSARQALSDSGTCGEARSILGLFVAADLAREGKPVESISTTQQKIARLRDSGPARESAWLDFLTGRLLLTQESDRSQALLRNAIAVAERQPAGDADSAKLRAYSYQTLISDAGQRADYAAVLNLLAAELKVAHPAPCAVGLGLDGALLTIVVRGHGGQVRGTQQHIADDPGQKAARLISAELSGDLPACAQIEVLAEASLQGLSGLLSNELAWSYRLSSAPRSRGSQPPRSLVVSETEAPMGLRLQPLAPWPHQLDMREKTTVLRGTAATPSETLRAMTTATEAIIHAHGLVNFGLADASLLVLSPDANGQYALTAGQVEQTHLQGAPTVILSACHAAKPSPFLYTPWSLPTAFIDAGASAVFAATAAIPSADAGVFFSALLQRLRRGDPPSVALRDERLLWLRKDAESWVKNVLLFN